jgi:glycosyltransferase involved in cell wall biosynthesis
MKSSQRTRRSDAVGVLYVANAAKIGGANRQLMDIVEGLDRSRYVPAVVAPTDGPIVAWARECGIDHYVLRADDWMGRVSTYRRAIPLAGILLKHSIRIVHAMAPTCYRAAGLAGSLARTARVCHLGFPPAPGEIEWCFSSGPEAVIGCYEGQVREVRSEVQRVRPGCRLVAVPNGIDMSTFIPAPRVQADGPWRFGARHVVLVVGNLCEIKGYPTFLRAAARIQAAVDSCAFVLLGSETVPGYQNELEQLAKSLGLGERIHFLGWRPDVADILRAADVMVLPSSNEGLPLAILEAMACAKPVVATPVGGVGEAIIDGVTGVLVPVGDPERLAAAVVRVLRDPELAQRLGVQARRSVEVRYSLQRFRSEIENLYDGLVAARQPVRPAQWLFRRRVG